MTDTLDEQYVLVSRLEGSGKDVGHAEHQAEAISVKMPSAEQIVACAISVQSDDDGLRHVCEAKCRCNGEFRILNITRNPHLRDTRMGADWGANHRTYDVVECQCTQCGEFRFFSFAPEAIHTSLRALLQDNVTWLRHRDSAQAHRTAVHRIVDFIRVDDFVFPLVEHVCKPRGLRCEDVGSLFQAQCESCRRQLDQKELALHGAALLIRRVSDGCPYCGHHRLIASVRGLTVLERERLQGDRFFSTLTMTELQA